MITLKTDENGNVILLRVVDGGYEVVACGAEKAIKCTHLTTALAVLGQMVDKLGPEAMQAESGGMKIADHLSKVTAELRSLTIK